MARRRKAPVHDLPAGRAHRMLSVGIGEQLVERPRQLADVARLDAQAADAVIEPVPDPTGRAGDDRPARGERLDSHQPEGLGPQRRHHYHGGVRELLRELFGTEPARERDTVLHTDASCQAAAWAPAGGRLHR